MIQLAISYSDPCPQMPAKGTQNHALLEALQRGEYLTVMDALTKYGCYALSQRMGELRRMGWPVTSEMKTLPNEKRIAVYSLER